MDCLVKTLNIVLDLVAYDEGTKGCDAVLIRVLQMRP